MRQTYALSELFAELGFARSSYFYHRARLRGADKYADARLTISGVFERNHRCYGYRRIRAALGRQKFCLSEKVVQLLMRQECLVVAATRRRRYGSYLGEISPALENLINRDFETSTPNEESITDVTEFHVPAGKVYLSPMIDCFDGLVVSWSIGTRPDADLVNTMLDTAIEGVANSNDRPVVHSDRGANYRWPGWLTRIRDAKLIRSMSRKGCSPDNAACEAFFGRLKTELFYPGTGRPQPLSSSFRKLTLTSTGTTKSESRIPLTHSVTSNTERTSDLWHNQSKISAAPPPSDGHFRSAITRCFNHPIESPPQLFFSPFLKDPLA